MHPISSEAWDLLASRSLGSWRQRAEEETLADPLGFLKNSRVLDSIGLETFLRYGDVLQSLSLCIFFHRTQWPSSQGLSALREISPHSCAWSALKLLLLFSAVP